MNRTRTGRVNSLVAVALGFAVCVGLGTIPAMASGSSSSAAITIAATPDDAGSPRNQTAFAAKLADARRAYFDDLGGDRAADDRARQEFSELDAQHPRDPVVDAYLGSLELLESARTLAVWRKHTLAQEGLDKMDAAVNEAPDNLEARFVRALTNWHLPFFFHRKEQAEQDLAYLGPRAEQAARDGRLPPQLAAAALDYWGQVLADRDGGEQAPAPRQAFEAAIRVDPSCPAGQDARKRLGH